MPRSHSNRTGAAMRRAGLTLLAGSVVGIAGGARAGVQAWSPPPARVIAADSSGLTPTPQSGGADSAGSRAALDAGSASGGTRPRSPRSMFSVKDCTCMFTIGSTGVPEEFTREMNTAMGTSGFMYTSPGGCITWPLYICWGPSSWPREADGTQGAMVISSRVTLRSGIHFGVLFENRLMGGVEGRTPQGTKLVLSASGQNFAAVAGIEQPLLQAGDWRGPLFGRVAVGPAISRVKVSATGDITSSDNSSARMGFLAEAGVSWRVYSIYTLDVSLQRWQIGRINVGPYTAGSGTASQLFSPVSVDLSHAGAYVSLAVRP
jgi:hypothetical protein